MDRATAIFVRVQRPPASRAWIYVWLLIVLAFAFLARNSSEERLETATTPPSQPRCVYSAHGDIADCDAYAAQRDESEK